MNTLTDKTIFMCSVSPSVTFKVSDISHNKMSSVGGKLLTSNTQLIGVGVCPNLGPGPCAFVPMGKWSKTSSKIKINSSDTLTERSCINCSVGGRITAATSEYKVNISSSLAASVPLGGLPTAPPDIKAEAPTKTESKAAAVPEKNAPEKAVPDMNDSGGREGNEAPEAAVKNEAISENTAKTEPPDYPYALCDYKNCSEWQECEYLKADYSAASVNNDSELLDSSYRKKYPEKYEEYCRFSQQMNDESTEGKWSKAAHHIISGNQIFAPHPWLVKLANFYGYDINNGENCILLPTTHRFDSKENIIRQANAYVAMSYMKQQWHVGGHSYSMDSNTVENIYAFLEKTSSDNICFYSNYVEAVENEIRKLEAKYQKLSCRKNGYEAKRERFIRNMDSISHKVGEKLLSFRDDPKKSYPYYVSKEAVHYAFDVPNRKKFIIIHRDIIGGEEKTLAEKMTVTRYKKDDHRILFTDSSSFIIDDALEFIKFSENVRYFICLDEDFVFPWDIDEKREYIMNDVNITGSIEDYCRLSEQRIISFVEGRKNGEFNYEPAARIIRQRIRTCHITSEIIYR